MRNTEIDTVDRRKNERGIAVIVVVAIMVALIMVTTALLATVTRSTATAKVYIQKDLARIAALSGRAVALGNIKTHSATQTAQIDAINTGLFYSAASTDADFRDLKIAYGLVPVAKIRVPGRTYGLECPVWPAWEDLLSGTATSGGVQTYWQRPNETYSNYRYIFLSGFDKTLQEPETVEANSFYGTYYAAAIQDLGGCLNVNNNAGALGIIPSNSNDYDTGAFRSILTLGLASFPAALKSQTQYTFNDMNNAADIRDDAQLGQRLLVTPYGKVDANGIPMCINVYTASRELIEAVVYAAAWKSGLKIYRAADLSDPDPANHKQEVNIVTEDHLPGPTSVPLQNIANTIVASRNVGKSVTDICADVLSGLTNVDKDDQQRAATWAILRAIFGVEVAGETVFDSTNTAIALDPTWLTANAPGVNGIGRLVGVGSNAVASPVAAGTIGPGPYFRVFVRGALVNLAKNELVSTANLELIITNDANNDGTKGDIATIYQRWYENE